MHSNPHNSSVTWENTICAPVIYTQKNNYSNTMLHKPDKNKAQLL